MDWSRTLADEIITEFKKFGLSHEEGFAQLLALRLQQVAAEHRHQGYLDGFAQSSAISDRVLDALQGKIAARSDCQRERA